MENTYLHFLPEDIIYIIYSYMNYDELINITVLGDINWCKIAFIKYGSVNKGSVDREKYTKIELCKAIIQFESILVKIRSTITKGLYYDGKDYLIFLFEPDKSNYLKGFIMDISVILVC